MARADVAARQLLDRYRQEKLPVEPDLIAKELLGAIVIERSMAPDVSGMLVREPNRVVIGVNEDHAPGRRRFTVAHEIGHLLLHKGRSLIMDTDVRVNFRDTVSSLATDREEIEANRFAAALLMSEHLIRQEIASKGFDTANELVELLADRFAVSRQAMNYRLVNLGIIPTPVDLS
ncbi:ImmA/IrrE family metallo-endopeptidase [Nonomuraea fuscirosea]|uniref:ImmA/IrrE family metallo-endopeptidase n=1 Tax=Nonomuraea fuscirosea TaxID=1291556 RepID=UPI0033E32233